VVQQAASQREQLRALIAGHSILRAQDLWMMAISFASVAGSTSIPKLKSAAISPSPKLQSVSRKG
jgi:hypothetical protein